MNGHVVGTVTVTGGDTSWSFGHFSPGAAFAPFADAFGVWSRLMHAGGDRLDRSTRAELARAENRLDGIRTRIRFHDEGVWVDPFQINIDGELVEWKQY